MESPKHFSLKQVCDSIRKTINERYSQSYWVSAELFKLNRTSKGHCYPELVQKENDSIIAEIRGTIWANNFERIKKKFESQVGEPLKDNLQLLFLVKISYHPIYNIGLEIIDIDPSFTLGNLQKERNETILLLQKNGLLNKNQQLKMPFLPKKLAIISQNDSKGYADFYTLLEQHSGGKYHIDTFLFEATLQGDGAISSIISQLNRIQKVSHYFDAVVIIRGGGGEVGMHCYNSYQLCESMANFPLPIITGIGHSTNQNVAELIAFYNGITPSDTAFYFLNYFDSLYQKLADEKQKLPVVCQKQLLNVSKDFQTNIRIFEQNVKLNLQTNKSSFESTINHFKFVVEQNSAQQKTILQKKIFQLEANTVLFIKENQHQINSKETTFFSSVSSKLTNQSDKLNDLKNRIPLILEKQIDKEKSGLLQFEKNIQHLNPINILQRGYSIISNKKGILNAENQGEKSEELKVQTAFNSFTVIKK